MSDEIRDGGSVYPRLEKLRKTDSGGHFTPVYSDEGITLRHYFAAKAMQAHMMRQPWGEDNALSNETFDSTIARWAYDMADEMLRAGSEPQPVQYRELYADEKAKLDAADRLAAAVEDVKKVSAYLAIPADIRQPLERALEDVTEPTIPF